MGKKDHHHIGTTGSAGPSCLQTQHTTCGCVFLCSSSKLNNNEILRSYNF